MNTLPTECHAGTGAICSRAARAGCAPRVVSRPCGRCGHPFDDHDPVFGGAGCMHHLRWPIVVDCACTRWVPRERDAAASKLRTDATCQDDCLCREHHPAGAAYYVTCCRNRCVTDFALLLGPFPSHAVALGFVAAARRAAEEADARAVWYAYGTMAFRGPMNEPGQLNEILL